MPSRNASAHSPPAILTRQLLAHPMNTHTRAIVPPSRPYHKYSRLRLPYGHRAAPAHKNVIGYAHLNVLRYLSITGLGEGDSNSFQ